MAYLIEKPEDELQHMIGRLIWDNTALRHRIEALQRELETARQSEPPDDTAGPDA